MNREGRVEELIVSWLAEEAQGTGPDRVLRATFERTRATRQVTSWARWRERLVNAKSLATVGGAAAVLIVGVIGATLLLRPGGPAAPGNVPASTSPSTAPPTGTPIATPSPTASPTPPASFADGARPLPEQSSRLVPGKYRSLLFEAEITVTVPAGWDAFDGAATAAVMNQLGSDGEAAIGFWRVSGVYANACQSGTSVAPTVPQSVDDLVAVLAGMEGFEATTPTDVTFAGHDGKSLVLTALEGCVEPRLWVTAEGGCRCLATGDVTRHRITVVDVDGVVVLVDAQDLPPSEGNPGTSERVRVEMESIRDSIELRRAEG